MTPEQNWRVVVGITRATDEPPPGLSLEPTERYGDARRAAILWADGELRRLTEREGKLREAAACPPDSDLLSWVRMLADAWEKQQAAEAELADAKIIQFYDAAMSAIGSGVGILEHIVDGWRMDWYSPRIPKREHYWTSYRADILLTASELSDPTWEPVTQAGMFARDTRQKFNKWNEEDLAAEAARG